MRIKISKGLLYAGTFSFLWAVSIVISRYLLKNGENPLNLTVWINFFSALLWLFPLKNHWGAYKRLSKKDKSLLVFIGISGSIGISYLQSLSLANTSAVNFSFLYRTTVVFTVIFAWLIFREKITVNKLLLVSAIIIGSYLLTTGGKGISLEQGDVYTLLMAASAAFISNILVKHTITKMHPDLSGAVTIIVTFFSLVILAVATNQLSLPGNLYWIIISGIIAFVQISLRNRAYGVATASFVTMIVSLTPVFVALLSFPLLGERLDFVQLAGGILIVCSGIFAEKLKM